MALETGVDIATVCKIAPEASAYGSGNKALLSGHRKAWDDFGGSNRQAELTVKRVEMDFHRTVFEIRFSSIEVR